MDATSAPVGQGEFLTLEDLRESVALTNVEINDLVHNHCKRYLNAEKFVGTIRKLNN